MQEVKENFCKQEVMEPESIKGVSIISLPDSKF